MKKIFSLFLALAMLLTLVPAALAGDTAALTYDLTGTVGDNASALDGGTNKIVVQTGDVITLTFTLSASEEGTTVSTFQNEILYDHDFFEVVSNNAEQSYVTSLQVDLHGNNYVYFNGMNDAVYGAAPTKVGQVQLKVTATSGESTISSTNTKAYPKGSGQYDVTRQDLHVSIDTQQAQTFTVTLKCTGGTIGDTGKDTVTYTVAKDGSITLPGATSSTVGQVLSYWQAGDQTYLPGASYTPGSNATLVAVWGTKETPKGPEGLGTIACSAKGSADGAITGTTSKMEYSTNANFTDAKDCADGTTKGLTAGTYYVRLKQDTANNTPAGEAVRVTIADGTASGQESTPTGGGTNSSSPGGGSGTTGGGTATPGTDKEFPFTDVSRDSYAYDAIVWAVDKGITTGTSATTFSPKLGCTRAQVVTFLWRADGSPEPDSITTPYTDVAPTAYYAKAVAWADQEGITKGTSATTFSPDQVCTRAQIVTFLARYADVLDGSTAATTQFTDVRSTAYYASAVAWALENGITNGTSTTTFSPNNKCTREQVVTFLYRHMNR